MKKYIYLLVLYIYTVATATAQNQNRLDSLTAVYQNVSQDSTQSLILYEIAREYRHTYPDTARLLANKGRQLAQKATFKRGIALNLNVLGIVELNKGDYLQALTYLLEGLKINEETQNQNDISVNLNNIGEVYRLQSNYGEALKYYQKALGINYKIDFKQGVAINLNNIGEIYKEQGKYKEALANFFESIKICEQLNDKARIALRLNNIGEIYARQAKYKDALDIYLKALSTSKELNNKLYMTIELNNIAAIYFQTNELEKSLRYANDALAIAKEINAKKEIKACLQTITDIYVKLANYAQAFSYYQLLVAYRDSLNNEEANKRMKEMQFNYEISQKQKEITLLEKENKLKEQEAHNQTVYIVFLGVGLLLLFVLATILYQQNKYKLQANNLLKEKNTAINQQNEELNAALETVKIQQQEMLAQNEELHQQQEELQAVNEALAAKNELIENQKLKLSELNDEIANNFTQLKVTSDRLNKSIQYAYNIQQIILPKKDKLDSFFQSHFSIYLPKDIVSGDFYWFTLLEDNKAIFALADCTGHGVPGAFMGMIGSTLLHEIIKVKNIYSPADILKDLHLSIRDLLRQGESQNSDGMDISVCFFEKDDQDYSYQITFAGAKTNIFYIKDEQIHQLDGDRITIGGFKTGMREFHNQTFNLGKGEVIYFTSDGFIDQHNKERKRFSSSKFRQLLCSIFQLPISEQESSIITALQEHQSEEEQRDDISVVGLKL